MVLGMAKVSPQNTPPALSTASEAVERRTFGISTNPDPIVAQLFVSTYFKKYRQGKKLKEIVKYFRYSYHLRHILRTIDVDIAEPISNALFAAIVSWVGEYWMLHIPINKYG